MNKTMTCQLSALLIFTFFGTSAFAQSKPASDWKAVVEAAKREGMVKCACPPRREFAVAFKKGFEDAYPGITVEITAAASPAFPLRVAKEQAAKMFLWDIYTFGPGAEIFDLKNKGGLESMWDYLSLPEVLNDSAWIGGIKDRFLDVEQKHIFGMFYTTSTGTINRDAVPDLKIRSFEDLLSPALKGKLVSVDPRIGGSGESLAAAVFQSYGRDGLKKLFVDQDVLLDERQSRSSGTGGAQSAADLAHKRQSRFAGPLHRRGDETKVRGSVRSRIGSLRNERILPGDFQESAQSKRNQGFCQLAAFPRRPKTHCRGKGRTQRAHRRARRSAPRRRRSRA